MSDLIQYAIITVIAGYSVWRLARPYLKTGKSESGGGCGSGEGCGGCKGCASLNSLTPPQDEAPVRR